MQQMVAKRRSLPSSRELLSAVFKDARRVITVMVLTFLLACLAIPLATPSYIAKATLLVLLSSDYLYRQEAGTAQTSNALLEKEAILKSEVEILTSASLARATIEKLGLDRLYPKYTAPPGWKATLTAEVKDLAARVGGAFGLTSGPAEPAIDPVALAIDEFAEDLSVEADKTGNIIEVRFRHAQPMLASAVVNTLIGLYEVKRQAVYADVQSSLVADQVTRVKQQLDAAAADYAGFKSSNGISDLPGQRALLLQNQEALRQDAQAAESTLAQESARLAATEAQLEMTAKEIVEYSDVDVESRSLNVRKTLEDLQARRTLMAQNYQPTSQTMLDLDDQIAAQTAALRKAEANGTPTLQRRARNPVYAGLESERIRAGKEREVARVRLETARRQLQQTVLLLGALDSKQAELDQLARQVEALDASYRSIAQTYESQRISEGIAAQRTANIRLIETASVPVKASNIRSLILVGAVLCSLFAGLLAVFFANYFRRGYLMPEVLERTLGIPVLVSINEHADLASAPGRRARRG